MFAVSKVLNPLRGSIHSQAIRMASVMGQKYDLVIFGASGYTGEYAVKEVAQVAKSEETEIPLSWAIAGRSKDKLLKSLEMVQKETGLDMEDVGIILADVSDQESLNRMAAQSTVVVNCVGPYQLYGEPVVRACLENGASHVDISGEPQFMERMQLKYNGAAEEAGVHIVSACGFDSIPSEMGLSYMMQKFKGELNSAEMIVKAISKGAKAPIHTGTMESAAISIGNRSEINKLRRQLFPTPLPKPKHKVPRKGLLHKNDKLGIWALPLPTDEPVVYRTQRYRHEVLNQRPIQFQGFLSAPNIFVGIGMLLGISYFVLICYFTWTRKLLLKYPEIMTAGVFSRAGADKEELKKVGFVTTLIGKGWSEPLLAGSDQHSEAPDSSIVVKVTGPDPGYGATSLMLVATAMTILREKTQCTGKGGVMTPGVAFENTKLIDRLVKRGMTFTVEE